MLVAMKKAGCYQVDLGVETGSDEALREYKGFGKDLVIEGMRSIRQAGLESRLFFIIGPPSKTVDQINKTIDFAIELDPDYAVFFPACPYPGTALYDRMYEQKSKLPDFEKGLKLNYEAICDVPPFSKEYLTQMTQEAFKRFYWRPKYIFKRIFLLRSLHDITKTVSGIKSLLRFLTRPLANIG
jgi:radical SAM superfamily enzyme YgiQ (UPF0313 family)